MMPRIGNIALVGAAALALSIAQPKPAEAGNAGRFIAGAALGAVAGALLYNHGRSHAYYAPRPYAYDPYYYAPPAYYAPPVYYAPPPYHHHRRYHRGGWGRW